MILAAWCLNLKRSKAEEELNLLLRTKKRRKQTCLDKCHNRIKTVLLEAILSRTISSIIWIIHRTSSLKAISSNSRSLLTFRTFNLRRKKMNFKHQFNSQVSSLLIRTELPQPIKRIMEYRPSHQVQPCLNQHKSSLGRTKAASRQITFNRILIKPSKTI
jgi:hypothetical protein